MRIQPQRFRSEKGIDSKYELMALLIGLIVD